MCVCVCVFRFSQCQIYFVSPPQLKTTEEYEDNSVPLDILVTDMDWHNTCYREQDQGYVDLAGQPGELLFYNAAMIQYFFIDYSHSNQI
jgi:hypothetical protein